MRRQALLLAAALAVGTAPVLAQGAERPAAKATYEQRLAAWRAQRADLARRLPGQVPPATAASELLYDSAYMVPAGDLDRDGSTDLVDIRSRLSFDDEEGFTESLRIDAYRGRDGKLLWSKSLDASCYAFPVFTKVGADGRDGVLVARYDCPSGPDVPVPVPVPVPAGAGVSTLTLSAYDGAGTALWERVIGGAAAGADYAGGTTGVYVDGIFDANPGGGSDLLVEYTTGAEAWSPDWEYVGGGATTHLAVVDGATGLPRPLPGSAFPNQHNDLWVYTVGDLDGDDRDDAVVKFTDLQERVVARAVQSVTGATLWEYVVGSSRDVGSARAVYVGDVGDATGDGTADLTLHERSYGPSAPASTVPVIASTAYTTLIDGGSGARKWRKPGSLVGAIGDADRKAGSELVLGSEIRSGSRTGFTVTAYTGSGARLWSTTRGLTGGNGDKEWHNFWDTIGDVHGDGVVDIGYAIVVPNGRSSRRDEGTINGRTGKVTRDPVKDMSVARVALDGRGADSYTSSTSRGVLTVGAWRGDTGAKLWKVSVAAKGEPVRGFGVLADKDRCGELVVELSNGSRRDGSTTTAVVLSGATGKPLWSLSRTGTATGTVGKPRAKSVTRYRKTC